MQTIKEVREEIRTIKSRNERVEADKAWETSWMRKLVILVQTYVVVVVFFFVTGQERPFIGAIVPVIAFMLSTMTIPFFKKMWITRYYHLS